jgi:predicted TIM-barrel fold metal-dependent hydrolase
MARRHDNLFLSTAFLGYVTIEAGYADDEHEYPFPNQLKRLKRLYERVGPDKLMFGTDWPWVEHVRKYVQDVDAIRRHADFMSAKDKEKFLGLNALRYLGSKSGK